MIGIRSILAVLATCLLVACATTGGERDTRVGMNSTSPVQAAETNTQLGLGYLRRGDLRIAKERLERAIDHDPDHVPAIVGLAMVHEQLQEDSAANRYYRRAARLAPKDGPTQNIYGVYLCRRGELEEADRRFHVAIEDPLYDSRESAYANAGVCAMRIPDKEKAEEYFRQALQIRSDHTDALFHMAELSYQQGNALTARAFLQRFESASDHDSESLLLGYRVEMALNNPSDAMAYANRLERDFPNSGEADDLKREMPDDY